MSYKPANLISKKGLFFNVFDIWKKVFTPIVHQIVIIKES